MTKTYTLKRDCRNIGKETGDYYNGEYGSSEEKIAELIANGTIEEEIEEDKETEKNKGESEEVVTPAVVMEDKTVYKTKYDKLKKSLDAINIYEKHTGVKRLREIANIVYKNHLDVMPPALLQRLGGELSALFVSFGNAHAMARADHEISENIYKQVISNVQLSYLDGDTKYKVTEAKNLASKDLEGELDDVILKEATYKQWENVMETTKTLIMFIQSSLATKKSEAFINKDLYNEPNQRG